MTTIDLLRKMAGGSPDESNMQSVVAGLTQFGYPAGLDQPHRFAHFVAQLLHESGRFKYDQELWGPTAAQERYENRKDLGHSSAVPGEAFKFRGRAGIQITGRYNYTRFRDWCRGFVDSNAPDFEANPDAVNTDPWEGLVPIWYWHTGNPTDQSLNVYADDNNIEAVTRKINGGTNGLADRIEMYVRASLVLLGYEMKVGVVRRFQEAAGFTGRDIDDIPGQKTRSAMHGHLRALESLRFGDPVETEVNPIAEVRELLAQADQRLALIEGR